MYRTEFDTVLNVLNINNIIEEKKESGKVKENVYEYCGLHISFSGTSHAIISGIPLKLFKDLIPKFKNNPDIRFCNLRKVYVDSKEALLDILVYAQNFYHLNKLNYDELLVKVNDLLLSRININTFTWNENNINALDKKNDTHIRSLLDEFDTVVNPFMDTNVTFKDSRSYLDYVNIGVDSVDNDNKNFFEINIKRRNSEDFISSFRDKNKMFYSLRGKDLTVKHIYDYNNFYNRFEEILFIESDDTYIEYNITEERILLYGAEIELSKDILNILTDHLNEAINLAKFIIYPMLEKPKIRDLKK